MKQTLIILQVMIFVVVVFKVAATGQLFGKMDPKDTINIGGDSSSPSQVRPTTSMGDAQQNLLQKERTLYDVLEKRRVELDEREAALQEEEKKIATMKKEIQDRIDALLALEKRLDVKLAAEKEEDTKRFKNLAKILENAVPAKAGAMLEKLDNRTAAGITMNMKKDRAGIVLSHVSVQKVVEITREITRLSPSSPDR